MNFHSHLRYQDGTTNKPEVSMTYGDSSSYNMMQEEGADYCELMPLDLCLSSARSLNVDGGIYSRSSIIKMEHQDISYSEYRDTYSTSNISTPHDYSSTHSMEAEGGLDSISPDHSRSDRCSESTKHFQGEGHLDLYCRDYNSSRSPQSSDGTHVLVAEGGANWSDNNSNSSEDSSRSFGYTKSPPEESEVNLDNFDEVLILQDMFKSPAISASNENHPDFSTYAHTQRAKTDYSLNSSFSVSSYAEKYMQIKDQNKLRAKKYRKQKQLNIKEVENTIPQLEERNQFLKSEYESLKKKRDSLKQLLPQLHV